MHNNMDEKTYQNTYYIYSMIRNFRKVINNKIKQINCRNWKNCQKREYQNNFL